MLNVGVVGATGYTGLELLRLLASHSEVRVSVATSDSDKGRSVAEILPGLRGYADLQLSGHNSVALEDCDLVFFATPHATSMRCIPKLLKKQCRIIDLSADFRLKDPAIWQDWYGVEHACPDLLSEAVYGLPELNRQDIKSASLVANPGCYPTASTLALLPALTHGLIATDNIVIDAKSGVSGAGRKAALANLHTEVSESFKAYSVSGHRHLPEISQTLVLVAGHESINVTFVPHLLPINRGILATVYVQPADQCGDLQAVYEAYYRDEPFVELMPANSHPETRFTRGSNYCQLAIHQSIRNSRNIVIISTIDNLVKGAAGQAIQNMNLMYGLSETHGLYSSGWLP